MSNRVAYGGKLISSKGDKIGLVGSSSTTGTYGSKLNEIYTLFNALTPEEKLRSVIVFGDEFVYKNVKSTGTFFYETIVAPNNLQCVVIELGQTSAINSYVIGVSNTDVSGVTDNKPFKLYVI